MGWGDFAATPRFEVLRCIGAGGMGTVYEAIDKERTEEAGHHRLGDAGGEGGGDGGVRGRAARLEDLQPGRAGRRMTGRDARRQPRHGIRSASTRPMRNRLPGKS